MVLFLFVIGRPRLLGALLSLTVIKLAVVYGLVRVGGGSHATSRGD